MAENSIGNCADMIIKTVSVEATKAAVLAQAKELGQILEDIERYTNKALGAWNNDFTEAAKKDMAGYISKAKAKQDTMYTNLANYLNIVLVTATEMEKMITSNADLFDS